jgi:glycosyltransferase involved in cell wall biosynthesis
LTLCLFAAPGDLSALTGGYAYARKLLEHWPREQGEIQHIALPDGFPFPSQDDIEASAALIAGAAAQAQDRAVALIDGLAYGAMPENAIRLLPLPVVALVHHPLGLETGLGSEDAAALLKSEARALALAFGVVATSRATARTIREMFVMEPSRIAVAEPGLTRAPRAKGSAGRGPSHIVSVGSVTPRKGCGVLIDALSLLRDVPWRATIAGSLDRDPATARQVQDMARQSGLQDRIRFTGPLSEAGVMRLYGEADIFALASHYEGYGMVFAEAMARGLPIVCSGSGAVRETVPAAAGLHVEAGDAQAFAAALRRMLEDEPFRQACAEAAYVHAQGLPDWDETARIVAAAVEKAAA